MPWQLIYTSAPRGLLSGQSGFCTVARSGELREALVQRLEQLSSYHYLRVAEAATANRNPTVCAFRILDLRGSKYHVLTRILPCGLDFTARTNHLAHHLVFQAGELAQLPSPAAILRYWPEWKDSWQGEPRQLEDPALAGFSAAAKSCLPAQTWLRITGDAGRAAGLLESEYVRGCYLVCPPGSEGQVLEMFCETLELKNLNGKTALRPWVHTFTTFLQAEDNPADFQWRACQEGTPAYQQAVQRTTGLIPLRSVRVPNNSLIMVKAAREGHKPPPPPPKASTQTSLTLRRKEAGPRPPGMEQTDTGHWRKPVAPPEKPAFLKPGSLARIGIAVAVLLILGVYRIWFYKPPHPPQENIPAIAPVPVVPAPPSRYAKPGITNAVQKPPSQPPPAPVTPPDPAQLKGLSGEEPTYLFTTPNIISFKIPIDSIIRFRNLLSKLDRMDIVSTNIQLSINTDEWGFTSGAQMPVKVSSKSVLSATTDTGLECSFDYSDRKNSPNNPVAVQTSFSIFTPPKAFSVYFGYSPTTNGEPFRLLIVNESNPPPAMHLSMQWLRINNKGLVASLYDPLGSRLEGHFILPSGWHWQFQPFIRSMGGSQTNYLYTNWPSKDLPPPEHELDFAEIRKSLTRQLTPLKERANGLAQKLEQKTKKANLDYPLGKHLRLTNKDKNLVSFSAYTDNDPTPTADEFIEYLNSLKKRAGSGKWPHILEDDNEMQTKFQGLYDLWIEKAPETKSVFWVENTNYFSFVWQSLKDIEELRLEKQPVQDKVDKLQGRLKAVPDMLDKVAYVGLFIIDPPKPPLEMIRFQGP